MHHMLTAHNRVVTSLLLVFTASVLSAQQKSEPIKVLDLTAPVPRVPVRIPGGGGGGGRRPEPRRYPVPLNVAIQSVSPKAVTTSQNVTFEITVRNTGSQPYYLPVSRYPGVVHADGQRGRRCLLFKVRVPGLEYGRPRESPVGATFASTTTPDSTLALQPGDSILIRTVGILHYAFPKPLEGSQEVSLTVVAQEWTSIDEWYAIGMDGLSEEVKSKNQVVITVLPEQGVETRPTLPVAPTALQPQVPLIDLVAEPSRRTKSPGSVSGRMGGAMGGRPQPKPISPLSVRLESVSPSATQPEVRIVEILVTNVSGTPYSLPVGRDGNAAMKPGNPGRREIWFWLRAPRSGDPDLGILGGKPVYGSDVTKNSLLTLPPGGSVRVRFPVNLKVSNWFYKLKQAKFTSVPVHAALTEMWFDDTRTDTDFISRRVEVNSENTLTFEIQ